MPQKVHIVDSEERIVEPTDHGALPVTLTSEAKTAFGEVSVATPTPIIQIDFPYSVNTALIDLFQNQSGTVTHSNRQVTLQTGESANSSAEIRSVRILKYNPGQGGMARFTARFTTGVANSTQIAGIGNESDGLFFGYNGASFGILHRSHGSPEIRTLTVSTASSTEENITITLDGDAVTDVAVTNSGNATTTANEIAAHDYSDVGTGWTAKAIGNKVEFKSWDGAVHTGTYSLSGASTAAGTFAQNVAGVVPTEDWIPQSSWNGVDKFDGNGITGVTLDPTKGNVYQIKYQWLGYGLLTFYAEDPDDGELHLIHSIEYANANTIPSLGDPSMCLMARVANSSNTSNLTLQSPCFAGFVEGKPEFIGIRLGARSSKADVSTSLRPILSIRQGQHFNSKAVQTFGKIMRIAMAADYTKPVSLVIIENGTLTDASWASINSNISALQIDTSASAITGGTETFSVPLGQTGNHYNSFIDDYFSYSFTPGKIITFAGITGTAGAAQLNVSLNLLERV